MIHTNECSKNLTRKRIIGLRQHSANSLTCTFSSQHQFSPSSCAHLLPDATKKISSSLPSPRIFIYQLPNALLKLQLVSLYITELQVIIEQFEILQGKKNTIFSEIDYKNLSYRRGIAACSSVDH